MNVPRNTILLGDVLERLRALPDACVQTVVTSPPYWGLRDYGVAGQIGLEPTPAAFVARMVEVFREVRRVLRADGTAWVNLGDSYANDTKWGGESGGMNYTSSAGGYRGQREKRATGLKPKDLVGIPWRVAFALQDDGWYLRSDIIWHKPNPMPESATDRPTRAHEYIFLLSKSARYYYDADAIREPHTALGRPPGNKSRIYIDRDPNHHAGEKRRPDHAHSFNENGRNKRTVWTVATAPYAEAHFATFPPKLIEPCILAGSRTGDVVLDPFMGSGTVAMVARQWQRDYLGVELNPAYIEMAERRLATVAVKLFAEGIGA
jgi:DNA modification methylase